MDKEVKLEQLRKKFHRNAFIFSTVITVIFGWFFYTFAYFITGIVMSFISSTKEAIFYANITGWLTVVLAWIIAFGKWVEHEENEYIKKEQLKKAIK